MNTTKAETIPLNVAIPDPDYLGGASTRVLTADTPKELSNAVRKWITESGYGASDIGALFNVYRDDAMVGTMRYNARFEWNDEGGEPVYGADHRPENDDPGPYQQ